MGRLTLNFNVTIAACVPEAFSCQLLGVHTRQVEQETGHYAVVDK